MNEFWWDQLSAGVQKSSDFIISFSVFKFNFLENHELVYQLSASAVVHLCRVKHVFRLTEANPLLKLHLLPSPTWPGTIQHLARYLPSSASSSSKGPAWVVAGKLEVSSKGWSDATMQHMKMFANLWLWSLRVSKFGAFHYRLPFTPLKTLSVEDPEILNPLGNMKGYKG